LVLSIGGCLIVFMFLSLYLQQRFWKITIWNASGLNKGEWNET
jgi:hypothetical protein